MKDNLELYLLDIWERIYYIIYELPEYDDENCEEKLHTVFNAKLGLGTTGDEIKYDRVHPLGTNRESVIRPIVAKLTFYGDREFVRERGISLNSNWITTIWESVDNYHAKCLISVTVTCIMSLRLHWGGNVRAGGVETYMWTAIWCISSRIFS